MVILILIFEWNLFDFNDFLGNSSNLIGWDSDDVDGSSYDAIPVSVITLLGWVYVTPSLSQ